MPSMTVKRIIYKLIVPGDLKKFNAKSNVDSHAGGGARDLRFSPSVWFFPEFKLMFPNEKNGILQGCFCWDDGEETNVRIHPPTKSRGNEIRIANVNECFPRWVIPSNADDCILLLIQDDDKVRPCFTTRMSLEHDDWYPEIKQGIIKGLDASRNAGIAPAGYLDLEFGKEYTNGK